MSQAAFSSPPPRMEQSDSSHVVGGQPDILKKILSPGFNLSLWERSPQPEIMQELSSLKASALADVRCETTLQTFDEDVSALIRQRGLNPEAFPYWRKDLARLADIYFPLSQGRQVTMRLESSDQARCPRFHVDRTHLRLLCTYRGESTEWLSEAQTDREAQCSGAPNEEIIRLGEPSRFGLFTVGVMKGSAYPDNADFGLVHRSPPVEGPDRTRVLFCLDC